MAKTTYLGANVEISTDSFGGWLNKTNQLIYDMGTIVLTAGPVAQPNTTNGAAVTGNTHINGIVSANTLTAVDELRGGTVSTPANLKITTNTVFQDSALVEIQSNTNLFNVDANNTVISSNVNFDGGSTKDFVADFGDVTFTSILYDIAANTFNVTGTSNFDGPILNVDTADFSVTANTLVTAETLNANVGSYTIGFDGNDDLVVNSNTQFNDDVSVAGNQINNNDLRIEGNLTVIGDTFLSSNSTSTLSESAINELNIVDTLKFESGSTGVISDIIPGTAITYDLGSSSNAWNNVYATTFNGALSGNASTASKWKTARTINLSGDLSGSVSISGASNVTLNATVNNTLSGIKTFTNTTILQSTTLGQAAAKIIKPLNDATNVPALIVAGDGEASDIIAEFRANSNGSAVDTSDDANSLDAIMQIFSNGDVVTEGDINAVGNITASSFNTSGAVNAGSISGDIDYNDITNPPTIGNSTITIVAGNALTGGGGFTTNQTFNETVTINHGDTSSQSSVNNSGGTVIQDVVLDTYGHVTGLTSYNLDNRYYTEIEADTRFVNSSGDTINGNLVVTDFLNIGENGGGDSTIQFYDDNSNAYRSLFWDNTANDWRIEDNSSISRVLYHSGNIPNASITINAGGALTGGGTFTTNQNGNETITINHQDTSSQSSVNNSGGTVIQDITLDSFGHITSLGSTNLDTRYLRGDTNDVSTGTLQITSLGVGTPASTNTGEIRATGDITAFYSDARLKDFKGTISNALDKIESLNGYYYTANKTAQDLGYSNKLQVGVSAQEVQAILPEVVARAPISDNEDVIEDYLTVKYEKLVPLLIEAIKEQNQRIKDLESKLG